MFPRARVRVRVCVCVFVCVSVCVGVIVWVRACGSVGTVYYNVGVYVRVFHLIYYILLQCSCVSFHLVEYSDCTRARARAQAKAATKSNSMKAKRGTSPTNFKMAAQIKLAMA
jgi:hypothetical protein